MKKGLFAVAALICFNFTAVQAQDEEITDKDLYNYALLMQVVEQMKAEISPAIQTIIDNQDGFDVKRYIELKSGGKSEAKLKELGANDFEVKFMIMLTEEQEERIDVIKEVNNKLAQKMVGVKTYKAIKSALSSDADLKAKYDEIAKRIAPPEDEA
ncbi:hypothetical protein JKA74_15245 [Marivirga sp. S37H4]|uniref:DUF4168 domain-containing protein n=1 Tax=Marivirga aurantiaca TaxID=2802615 RepID=A0A934X030_9BACT|nr:hypothetical protein [Marivirga aurantiaca]MBK6266399.1 hypothetical protein [Marivirga aurantiaca]